MKYFITGGCGFLGSNLAAELIKRGEEVFLFDNLTRQGSVENLKWLKTLGSLHFFQSDIRSYHDVDRALLLSRPQVIFHFAGQVAMTTSIDNPRLDFETNVIGGNNVLEVVRKNLPETILIYSSTNKVYGDLDYLEYIETSTRYRARGYEQGFDESMGLDFRSPYGCSKGAIDQYMLDFSRLFGLRTVVFRHSSIFGGRQFSTFDQGWVGWFVQKALSQQKLRSGDSFTISGTGKQVRDVLFSSDLVNCYLSAVEKIDSVKGQVFNIGGGIENSLSLLELFKFLEHELSIQLSYTQLPWRQSDQKVFVANIEKAKQLLDWKPKIGKNEGLLNMIHWVRECI